MTTKNKKQPSQASLDDLKRQALEHYNELSAKCHHFNSFVEQCIKEYQYTPTDKEIEEWADKNSLIDDPHLPNLGGINNERKIYLIEGAKAIRDNKIPHKS